MHFYSLASGSKGNCFVVKHNDTNIVIDCGGTKRYLNEKFTEIETDLNEIDALFITHSHIDHIGQIKMFAKQPIYAPVPIKDHDINIMVPYQVIEIDDLKVTAIPLSHDCAQTFGYIVETEEEKLVYVTDTGYFKAKDYKLIEGATYYIFESNHDPTMLMNSQRPYIVKQRILSMNGHLCNEECAAIMQEVVTPNTKEIVLAHISEEANDHELALATIREALRDFNIEFKTAKQYEIVKGGSY